MKASRRFAAWALVAAVLLAALYAARERRAASNGAAAGAHEAAPATSSHERSLALDTERASFAPPSKGSRASGEEDLAPRRLARASQTLTTYLDSTRYPVDSRPLGERPDLARPHAVATHRLPIRKGGGDARVELAQDRYFVASGEKVTLTARCFVGEAPAPCDDLRGAVEAPGAQAAVDFKPSEEGYFRALVDPQALGLGSLRGAVAVVASLRIGGESGTARYDFELTPSAPATFAGFAGEALEEGSLVVRLRVRVERPGRYVIRARFADARGQRFALATFNGLLREGEALVPLRLFGKLARDAAAESPYRVGDLEGFRLLEDVSPDREAMASIDGDALTTRKYSLSDFSDDVWTSPEKARHVAALEQALDRAGDE